MEVEAPTQDQDSSAPTNGNAFYAYEVQDPTGMTLGIAPQESAWMEQTEHRFAYRCLPMIMANAAGWFIRSSREFSVWWNGLSGKQDLSIQFSDGLPPDNRILSHFGYGVLTFALPYLFRTPSGINLWVKGPEQLAKGRD